MFSNLGLSGDVNGDMTPSLIGPSKLGCPWEGLVPPVFTLSNVSNVFDL